jgi:hypothetical protein
VYRSAPDSEIAQLRQQQEAHVGAQNRAADAPSSDISAENSATNSEVRASRQLTADLVNAVVEAVAKDTATRAQCCY